MGKETKGTHTNNRVKQRKWAGVIKRPRESLTYNIITTGPSQDNWPTCPLGVQTRESSILFFTLKG